MIRRPMLSLLAVTTTATALVLTSGAVVHADGPAPEPTATATQPPSEQPPEDPADDPSDDPADEPSEEPSEEPADEPTDKPDDPSDVPPNGGPGTEPEQPVFAYYNGRLINLAKSWEGATSCTELPGGEVHCYDTDEEALSDPSLPAATREATRQANAAPGAMIRPPRRCVVDYWCLYQHAKYKGKILRFAESGKKKLSNWGMGNKLSSVYYQVRLWDLNYGDARVIDSRSWPVSDRVVTLSAGSDIRPAKYPNFKRLSYPGGGNWNDKADYFQVRRA
ncbi:peptidase inhibitor family I36 protein [Streptomyces sp. CC224B]|uniref:peptidase inhibitor family I36 protein n=1 Tax=Streptomyces sp. CC224B TaxID=3044571 RepID=UPI0024A9EA3D|nr:peptidase inhibitor family I36 protein [Streptomyces sp. CC224B]